MHWHRGWISREGKFHYKSKIAPLESEMCRNGEGESNKECMATIPLWIDYKEWETKAPQQTLCLFVFKNLVRFSVILPNMVLLMCK